MTTLPGGQDAGFSEPSLSGIAQKWIQEAQVPSNAKWNASFLVRDVLEDAGGWDITTHSPRLVLPQGLLVISAPWTSYPSFLSTLCVLGLILAQPAWGSSLHASLVCCPSVP